jgi:NAD dependent epimerase/dehydratase
MKKIFITGSEGFIGSHLVEFLVKKNFKVKALVQYNGFNSWGWLDSLDQSILKKIDIVLGDIRDLNEMILNTKNQDAVIHLAALIGIPYSYVSPKNYIDTNCVGTLNVMQAAKINKIKKIIHTSTSEVYGTAKYVPMDENHPLNAQSPYSASKISADHIAQSFFNSFNLPLITLRPFNAFGPRQSMRAIIPTIISQAISNQYIKVGNLKPTRDFNYVEDIANGFYLALKSKNKKIFGEVINLGTGYEISIKNLLNIIKKVSNKKLLFKIDHQRVRYKKSEVFRLKASNLKAMKLIKWKPKYSGYDGLCKAIKLTYSWYEKNKKCFKSHLYNI